MIHIGCIVSKKSDPTQRFMVTKNHPPLEIRSLTNGEAQHATQRELIPSFQEGDWVIHRPSKSIAKVLAQTNRQFCVVRTQDSEHPKMLPLTSLTYIRSPKEMWVHGAMKNPEAIRLFNLAHALQFWDRKTGALSSYSCDPLPHQIHWVHRLLASGQYNWMIADDVGLGKPSKWVCLYGHYYNKHRFNRS